MSSRFFGGWENRSPNLRSSPICVRAELRIAIGHVCHRLGEPRAPGPQAPIRLRRTA